MDKIQLKRDSEPIDLTGGLLIAAYYDAKDCMIEGATKSVITMGLTKIKEKEKFISVVISEDLEDTSPISKHLMHIKNRIKCEANMADKHKVLDIINQYAEELSNGKREER